MKTISALFALFTISAHAATSLSFDAEVLGTLGDNDGTGTGFTHRLPGSGSSIPSSDPLLNLDTTNGRLVYNSARADFNSTGFGRNLGALDAPAVLLSNLGTQDFEVEARFTNITVDGLSDQVGIFAGVSVNNLIRGGALEGGSGTYQASYNYSFNGVDGAPTGGAGTLFSPYHDAIFKLGRIGGTWHFSWDILDNPASGSVTFTAPGLDSQPELYVGIYHNDARNFPPQTVNVEYFNAVPEPSSLLLLSLSAGVIGLRRKRQLKS